MLVPFLLAVTKYRWGFVLVSGSGDIVYYDSRTHSCPRWWETAGSHSTGSGGRENGMPATLFPSSWFPLYSVWTTTHGWHHACLVKPPWSCSPYKPGDTCAGDCESSQIDEEDIPAQAEFKDDGDPGCHSVPPFSKEFAFQRVWPKPLRNGSAPSSVTSPCLTHTGTEYSNNHVAEDVSMPGSYLIATNSGLIYNLFASPKW